MRGDSFYYRDGCANYPCSRPCYGRAGGFEPLLPPPPRCPPTEPEGFLPGEAPRQTRGQFCAEAAPDVPDAALTARQSQPPGRCEHGAALIPFASGGPIQLASGANGSRSILGLIGFGAGTSIVAPVDPVNIAAPAAGAANMAFSIPEGGTLTSMSAFFSLTTPGNPEFDNIVTAQLYISPYPNDSFMPIAPASVCLGMIRAGAPAGETLHGRVAGLSVPLLPETRLLMVFSNITPQHRHSALSGFMSAGLRII